MILMFDTNVILDIIEAREPFFKDSLTAVSEAAVSGHTCLFSAGSVKDIFYLVKRHTGSAVLAKTAVTELSTLAHICDTAAEDIRVASVLAMPDFEDAVLAATAQREGAELIITRNIRDFSNSPVPAVSPKDFKAPHEWDGVEPRFRA